MLFDLTNVVVFLAVALGFVWATLLASRLIQPRAPGGDKALIYECGELPVGAGRIQFNFRFYILALIFLIFEVEIAFVFPVAVVFREWLESGRAAVAFAEIFLFIGILSLGLVYLWRKGELSWHMGEEEAEEEAVR
ncbi:MAG: NADH-quinone oxidoreductase subunit A [Candidatus Eisenbacteria bacterium]